jgi:LDH2 family malate/lactate/ureidoglycolate dehydrogenase
MPETEIRVPFRLIERFMTDAFRRLGLSEADAAVSADVLITADKQGIDTHGVSRFKSVYVDRIRAGQVDPRAVPEFVRRGPATAVIDGHNGMGQVVSKAAMSAAMEMARGTGMGMAVVRNSNHYGIAGYYVSMAASEGLIGLTGTNARPSVAPTFGSEPMLGTNPLAFGIPTDEDFPFILDCATSASQRGKIEVCARTGRAIPDGWAVDAVGNDLHDAAAVLKNLNAGTASLLPLGGKGETTGGHKGYGRNRGGNPLLRPGRRRVSARTGRLSGKRETRRAWARAFFHRHRRRGFHRSGLVPESLGKHTPGPARFGQVPGPGPHLYSGRERIPGLDGKKRKGRVHGRAPVQGNSECTG